MTGVTAWQKHSDSLWCQTQNTRNSSHDSHWEEYDQLLLEKEEGVLLNDEVFEFHFVCERDTNAHLDPTAGAGITNS